VPDGWLRLDVGAVAGFLGVDLDDVDALENATADADGTVWPMQLAAAIAGAGTAESTGELEVDGETVHRYRVTVPLEDLTAAELGDALDTLGSLVPGEIDLPESITYDVDVAADDQLRRIAASLELAGVAVTASMEVEAREDVVVDLPDPDDVIDIAGLLAGIVEQALADGREALGDAGGALGDLFGGLVDGSGDALGGLLGELLEVLGAVWDEATGALGDVVPELPDDLGSLLDDVFGS
jgi:hypothetical protein